MIFQHFSHILWEIRKVAVVKIYLCWGFNDTSTHVGHFVLSPREREKRDERGGQGKKRIRNEREETEEIKAFPFYP